MYVWILTIAGPIVAFCWRLSKVSGSVHITIYQYAMPIARPASCLSPSVFRQRGNGPEDLLALMLYPGAKAATNAPETEPRTHVPVAHS